MWHSRSVTSTWMLSKCRMGVHPGFLQDNFSYFERKTLMERLLAHLCRMIVFHRLILVVSHAEGIDNSFPDLEERVKVLNKLYQCLVAFRMPEKVRKLVFGGPKNSGKTS